MSKYTDAAPTLSKAVTVTKFKADNPKAVAPGVVEDKEPTKAQTTAVYNALLTMPSTGIGYSGVARLTGVSRAWVAKLDGEMHAAKGAVWVY
jgi:hypothetical protein